MHRIIGAGIAHLLVGMDFAASFVSERPTPTKVHRYTLSPQSGPVVDTTKESKRARRRRLARERSNDDG